MNLVAKIASALGGGVGSTILEAAKAYFPPSMSDKEKSDLSLKITEAENKKDAVVIQAANDATVEFNSRIKEMEGTAGDLKTIPIVGHLVIFLRGVQRPVWGFFTLWADYKSFSEAWDLSPTQDQMLMAINILVLGFLFGERAIKNVMPLIAAYFGKSRS